MRLGSIVLIAVSVAGVIATGVVAYAVYEWADGPEFSPTEWREARAKDSEHLDALATDAVESDALINKSRPGLRRMLGPPDRTTRRDRVWEWDIGFINDALGPGDAGILSIRFNEHTGRSTKATTNP